MRRRIRQIEVVALIAATLAISLIIGGEVDVAFAAPGTLEGVLVEPDGAGVQIRVAISGSFHYMVSTHTDRVVITLDGIMAESATHPLKVGQVTGVLVRPFQNLSTGADVVVRTRTPLEPVGSFIDGHILVVRLAAPGTVKRAPSIPVAPGSSSPPKAASPATRATPSEGSQATGDRVVGTIAGRTLISRAIHLKAGTSLVIQVDGLVRVAVGDPRVLDTIPISSRELLVTGRAAGHTTMYVWEGPHRLLSYTAEVAAAEDRLAGLRTLLGALFPTAAITVTEASAGSRPAYETPESRVGAAGAASMPRESVSAPPPSPKGGQVGYDAALLPAAPSGQPAGFMAPAPLATTIPMGAPAGPGTSGALVLSGTVETQMDRQKVEAIAHAFVPIVVNLLDVRRPVQLKLQVEVVELSRNALHTLGITWGGGQSPPGGAPSLSGGVYNLQIIAAPGLGANGLDLLIAQIQALSQRGLARLLAEPSLVVLAGRPASLLLGGQVPIPVAGPNGSVTLEYKEFGVILNVRPEYQDDGRVFMQITPEVSTLDFADAIKINGFTIPALRVRRAQTVVSMLPTQTLVLGGLLQHQDAEQVQKVPLLGDLPIIGPLFRSTTFQRQETDLVIFVTPVLVGPSSSVQPNP